MIDTRGASRGGRAWVALLGTTLTAILWSAAVPAHAQVLQREHYAATFEGHERTCGRRLHVETTMSGIRMTRSSHGGLPPKSYDHYDIHEVLTDAAGEGYIIDLAGLSNDVRVRFVGGSLYRYTANDAGQVFTIRTLDGRAVERNSGLLRFTYLLDTLGDSDPGNDVFLGDTVQLVKIAGTQPLQTQSEAEFCAAVDQAVQG